MTFKKTAYLLAGLIVLILAGYLFTQKNTPSEPLDPTPKDVTLSGIYVCLPHLDTAGPQTEECVFGLKTDDGVYYAVNFGASVAAMEQFEARAPITAKGFVVIKEALSSDQWAKYNMKGIFTINEMLDPKIVGENLEGEADPSRMTLGMKAWNWESALYNDGRALSPKGDKQFTLTLGTDGRFSAKTDCNSMSGKYISTTNTIAFSEIAMTKMYCEGSQEADFASLLENAAAYHFTSRGQLIIDLKLDSGTATFR